MTWAISDGVVTLRAFEVDDRDVILQGRDGEWERWLGPGSSDPAPTACIEVDGLVVGWVDADDRAVWLLPGEFNVGYSVFPEHRGHGYAARGIGLLVDRLTGRGPGRALLVIDEGNAASHGVARGAGAHLLADRLLPEFPSSAVYAIEFG